MHDDCGGLQRSNKGGRLFFFLGGGTKQNQDASAGGISKFKSDKKQNR